MPTRDDFFYCWHPRANNGLQSAMPKFETEEQAARYQYYRITILRKGGRADRELADKLDACGGKDGWCLSRACPVCARIFRWWVISESLLLLSRRDDLLVTTLVMPERQALPGQLRKNDGKAGLKTVKRQLERAILPPDFALIGGLDLSLEIDRRLGRPDIWQLHAHFISSGCTRKDLRKALGGYYPATDRVAQPLHIDRVREADRAKQYRTVSRACTDAE
jgi:hypothetical protein